MDNETNTKLLDSLPGSFSIVMMADKGDGVEYDTVLMDEETHLPCASLTPGNVAEIWALAKAKRIFLIDVSYKETFRGTIAEVKRYRTEKASLVVEPAAGGEDPDARKERMSRMAKIRWSKNPGKRAKQDAKLVRAAIAQRGGVTKVLPMFEPAAEMQRPESALPSKNGRKRRKGKRMTKAAKAARRAAKLKAAAE